MSNESVKSVRVCLLVALIVILAWPTSVRAGGRGEPGDPLSVRIELPNGKADLSRLHRMGIDLDGAFDGWARAWVLEEELSKLEHLGYVVTLLPNEGKTGLERLKQEGVARNVAAEEVPALYHDYATLTADLQGIASDHSDIARLVSVGKSVQGRELWMMKITRNPDVEEDEPEVAYVSSMHGDEVVGKEMCFNLINYLTDRYGTDPRVTDLVDSLEIWIMPSMNPDGTELGQRYNAQGVDLNRDFPDEFVDPVNTGEGRAPETAAIIDWGMAHSTNLSANYHCGVLVANYPRDGNPSGASVFSPAPAPDHDLLLSISRTYADLNLPMYNSNGGSFDHGVTNGAAWYAIDGGMQDWNYVWRGTFEVTMEVSNSDWPPASTLPGFWDDNLESMLAYFERAYEGVRGLVTDAYSGAPLAAEIRLDANPYPTYTDPDVGDYHRLVMPGAYTATVSASGYATKSLPVDVLGGSAVRLDVGLEPLPTDLQQVACRVENGTDEWLDAGETDDLSATLRNLGRAATGVGARLEPTEWLARVSRNDASFPDIATAEEKRSDAPHYEVDVSSNLPPGRQIGFVMTWDADQGKGVTEQFFLQAGAPACNGAAATQVPRPIADNQTATSKLSVSSAGSITDVKVTVDISHTYIGDLTIDLTSPAGTVVRLHDQSGGTTDEIVGTYGDDLTPAEPLTALVGESGAGYWRLDIHDHASGDTGTLNDWSIELCDTPVDDTIPALSFRDFTVDSGDAVFRWWPYPGVESYKVYRSTDPAPESFGDVTHEDDNDTDTSFRDTSSASVTFYLVTGWKSPDVEGPRRLEEY